MLNLNGTNWKQPIVYNWKPITCLKCNSFSHDNNTYPLNHLKSTLNHGRSNNRPPQPRFVRIIQVEHASNDPPNENFNPLQPPYIISNDLNQPLASSPTFDPITFDLISDIIASRDSKPKSCE